MKKVLRPFKKQAAALRYDPQKDGAPSLTAAGEGLLAERIVQTALENDVPVVKNEGISDMLRRMPLGSEIPPALYQAVAEILVFISKMDEGYKKKPGKK